MKKILGILICIVITGCETLGTQITDEQLTNIEKVGVVSLIGDQVEYSYVGLTMFNNKYTLYPFEDLNIDDHILETYSASLKRSNPKIEFLPIDVDFEAYKAAYKNQDNLSALDTQEFLTLFSDTAFRNNLNHVIVISRYSIQFDQAPWGSTGIGLRKRIGNDIVGSYVLLDLQLIDLTTNKAISKSKVIERDYASEFLWIEPFSNNDISQKTQYKDYLFKIIKDRSLYTASTLVRSPKEFEICSQQVYSPGFDIDGIAYTSREEVIEQIYKYRYQKIVRENQDPKTVKPPYENRFRETEEKLFDCIGMLPSNTQ